MVSFKTLFSFTLLATSALAAPRSLFKPVTLATLIADVNAIDAAANKQTAALTAYSGGYIASLPLLADFAALHIQLEKTIYDTGRSPVLNASDSLNLAIVLANSLVSDIPKSIDILIAKEPIFAQEFLKGVMHGLIELLASDNKKLSANLLAIFDDSIKGIASLGVGVITAAIQKGVDAYA